MSLPELHGWLPAGDRAKADGLHPSTVRSRALRGAYETTPNPFGRGALYRPQGVSPSRRSPKGSPGFVAVRRPVSGQTFTPSQTDVRILGALPASITGIAAHLVLGKGTVGKRLAKLEAAGLAEPAETVDPGPKGGRPAIIWRRRV